MANLICLSPLKFYDSPTKQDRHKTYAFGHISSLVTKLGFLPSFQFVLPENVTLNSVYIRNLNDERITGNIKNALVETGFSIIKVDSYKVVVYNGILPFDLITHEGKYYLELNFSNSYNFYSEIFCATNSVSEYIELEYWNRTGNFYIKNGIVTFPTNFHFKILLKTEIGKPEYTFEEESVKRLGYTFVESQVSKKIYRFNVVVPEFICDALRLVRLCDNKIIKYNGDEYEAITFEMDADWQIQGDLASVTCEFETDNVIVNLGGFEAEDLGGDYNNDHNNDYNIE